MILGRFSFGRYFQKKIKFFSISLLRKINHWTSSVYTMIFDGTTKTILSRREDGKSTVSFQVNLQNLTFGRSSIFTLHFIMGFIFPYLIFSLFVKNNSLFGLDTFLKFAQEFEFNPIGYFLIRKLTDQINFRVYMLIICIIYLVYILVFQKNMFQKIKESISWVHNFFLIFLLFSPVVNPWYFLILLPFYCINYSRLSVLWMIPLISQLAYITEVNFFVHEYQYIGFYNISENTTLIEIILIAIIVIFFLVLR